MKNSPTVTTEATAAKDALNAVLAVQQNIAESSQTIERLNQLIKDAETQQPVSLDTEIADIKRRLEDALAAQATGAGTEAEVGQLQHELVSTEEKARENAQRADSAQRRSSATIAGLTRQLEGDTAKLKVLNKDKKDALIKLLWAEAENLGFEFVKHAVALSACFERIYGVERILQEVLGDYRPLVATSYGVFMEIPVFNLNAFDGQAMRNYPGIYYSSKIGSYPDIAYTAGRLKEAGVVL